MNEDKYDGHRLVDAAGQIRYRVRGSRVVNTVTGQTEFRIRADDRLVDAHSNQLRFRIRDGLRVVDATTGSLAYRLRA